VINDGRIEQIGSPDELYDAPASEFVMSFLGPVTLLDGRLVRAHDIEVVAVPFPDAYAGRAVPSKGSGYRAVEDQEHRDGQYRDHTITSPVGCIIPLADIIASLKALTGPTVRTTPTRSRPATVSPAHLLIGWRWHGWLATLIDVGLRYGGGPVVAADLRATE